jgi:hypothetical protein
MNMEGAEKLRSWQVEGATCGSLHNGKHNIDI